MTTSTDIGTLITQTPGICGGRPRIAGTGVSVRRIVGWYKMGLTPEEIATEIPHLDLSQVHAALAYYHANRLEMDTTRSQRRRRRRIDWSVSTESPGTAGDDPVVLR